MDVLTCRLGAYRVSRILGIPYDTLHFWIKTGVISTTTPAHGKGSRRSFSFLDIIRAQTVVRLRAEGISMQTIRKAVAELSERFGVSDPLTQTARLVVAGDRLFWALDDATLLDVLKAQLGARPLILVDMSELVLDLSRKLEEVCAA